MPAISADKYTMQDITFQCMNGVKLKENHATARYREDSKRILKYVFPNLTDRDLDEGINYSISKRYKPEECQLYNNYTEKTANSTLMDMTDYIMRKEPILTSWGVLFKKHDVVPNPLTKMMDQFMKNRNIHKKEMFKYPKYSEFWSKFNLFQLLDKQDCNSIYGILGLFSSIFYNLHVAASITSTGQSCVSAMGMFFESFLSNNVKFGSLDQLLHFIDMVNTEDRHYNDTYILDRQITRIECLNKLILSCGWEWVPDEEDADIVWKILHELDDETVTRLYYKNNLYDFIENEKVFARIDTILSKLNHPFMDPNSVPDEIKDDLAEFTDLLKEYVYYSYQIIDKVDRMKNMPRNVALIIDTDSNLVSLDAWYRCVASHVNHKQYKLLASEGEIVWKGDVDEYGEYHEGDTVWKQVPIYDYDILNDEEIEMEKELDVCTISPCDGLRYSIINIISHVCGELILDYMEKYTKNNNSWSPNRKCMMIAKNEFLFKRVLMTLNKKNYASIQEVQEGNYLGSVLDIKGLPIDKSSMNQATRTRLKKILYEDILKVDTIDQLRIIKDMARFESEIHNSLSSGSKDFYKPVSAKSLDSYPDPMRVPGIKAEIVWNELKDPDAEGFDYKEKNAMDIVKVDINMNNIEPLKYSNPDVYERILKIIPEDKNVLKSDKCTSLQKAYKGQIKTIGIPKNVETPEWVLNYIDYGTIINDNIKNMPLESIGMGRNNCDHVNFTNIVV